MTEPLALTPVAALSAGLSPGSLPKSTMPEPAVQRKAWLPLSPTITEPSPLTPPVWLRVPPGRTPSPTMPPPAVQRKACEPEAELPVPTTTEPSPLTALAPLSKTPPGRSPSGVRMAAAEAVETAPPSRMAATAVAATSEKMERCDLVIGLCSFCPCSNNATATRVIRMLPASFFRPLNQNLGVAIENADCAGAIPVQHAEVVHIGDAAGVLDRHDPTAGVINAAAESGGVAGQDAVADTHRPAAVVDAAP